MFNKLMILKNFYRIKHKVIALLCLVFIFTFLYMIFDDDDFGGVNKVEELIKEEVLKEKIKKEIKEKWADLETVKGEIAIEEKTKEVKKDVKEKEIKEEKIKPNLWQKFFNRLYFSVITGTTLGYGDIYPVSNGVKLLTMLHSLSTIILILL